MAMCVAVVVWMIWAFVPDYILQEKIGLAYYPSKWWAICLPVMFSMAISFTVVRKETCL
jgi:hypothetical protein